MKINLLYRDEAGRFGKRSSPKRLLRVKQPEDCRIHEVREYEVI
ncbi:hypothetical protein [Paenibacillus polymyxa]|jgi:hypothetical protein|nr:hypothetical protein [Paenibacillus polymyxa]